MNSMISDVALDLGVFALDGESCLPTGLPQPVVEAGRG